MSRRSKWKYVLDEPLVDTAAPRAPADFDNAWLRIRAATADSTISIRAGYAWDGCTMAPDWRGTQAASCLHDAIYQFAEAIAAAWGWRLARVLRWGDDLFRARMRRDGAPPVVRWLYYWAVRLLGMTYHLAARRLRQPATVPVPGARQKPKEMPPASPVFSDSKPCEQ